MKSATETVERMFIPDGEKFLFLVYHLTNLVQLLVSNVKSCAYNIKSPPPPRVPSMRSVTSIHTIHHLGR